MVIIMTIEQAPVALDTPESQLLPAPTHHAEEVSKNPAAAYLASLGSRASRRTMSGHLGRVAQMLGAPDLLHCPWHLLRRHHVQAVIELLSGEDKAPATINTCLAALKGVATEAWAMKQIDTDTYMQIQRVRSVRGHRLPKGRALSRNEIAALYRACDQDAGAKGCRDGAIFGVLLGCGLRRSELVGLDLADWDRQDGALRVLGKGNKERRAFIPSSVQRRLRTWVDEIRGEWEGPLFTRIRRHDDVTDQRLSDQAIYHLLSTRCMKAGIDMAAPHDLRRTFASLLLDQGEDIVTVKDALGHASITTTQRYDRRGEERLRQASQRIDFA